MFVDASALCAILLDEPDALRFATVLASADIARTSPVAIWETTRAVVREKSVSVRTAHADVQALLNSTDVLTTAIGEREQALAIEAFDRFGKGRHAASLNMGDCFAYACARSLSAPMLYKGQDFARTDIMSALDD